MKKKFWAILISMAMMLSLVACSSGGEDKSESKNKSQIMFIGSSTLAPVMSKISLEFIESYGTWNKVNKDFSEDNIEIYVSAGGSGQGVQAVIDKTANFGMVARKVKDEEKEKIENEKEYQVGIDALTIAVNPKNPILKVKDNLTSEEIAKIFSGEYKTWEDVDSSLPDKEIVVVTRDIGGGAHEVFQKAIMGDTKVKADAIQAASMGALVSKVIENEYAIGYASYGVANQNEGKISKLKVDGVEANAKNILSGDYKIQRPLLILGSGDPTAEQQAFIDYVLGTDGQAIVEELGFIPMNK
ncbi:phosphate ABC transporter substrate-binding protein [Terrisporobacter mayombei]|uniref:Phosphate-binding protein PstS n=1 Tax=Terrisporobacter mayombei TaxID=1541 RepID=A0ABY9Q3G3_9FIRM|nr:phosphate ABC transporter substrate-binding protein [Terrisporobacter mayombei]MCC3867503.1 phosphate ABC transporter substrate-binding protein [Terrisporobacter mayombei]WMT81765.1 Phosphate-binding protein PstS [Terrisporobacter mayombei]